MSRADRRQLIDFSSQTRNPPRRGIALEDASADTATNLGLGKLERVARRAQITLGDRRVDLLDEGSDTAAARPVDRGTLGGLANALLG